MQHGRSGMPHNGVAFACAYTSMTMKWMGISSWQWPQTSVMIWEVFQIFHQMHILMMVCSISGCLLGATWATHCVMPMICVVAIMLPQAWHTSLPSKTCASKPILNTGYRPTVNRAALHNKLRLLYKHAHASCARRRVHWNSLECIHTLTTVTNE